MVETDRQSPGVMRGPTLRWKFDWTKKINRLLTLLR